MSQTNYWMREFIKGTYKYGEQQYNSIFGNKNKL